MAVCDVASTPAAIPSAWVPPCHDQDVCEGYLVAWDRDIKRAARWAAISAHSDSDESKDFAQEARLKLYLAVNRHGPLPEQYVRRLISNVMRTARARSLKLSLCTDPLKEGDEEVKEVPDIGGPGQLSATSITIRRLIAGLPRELGETFELLYVEGLSQREAARSLGVTQPRVAQLHAELLRIVRCRLTGRFS